MQKISIALILLLKLLVGCEDSSNDDIRSFIPGVYVKQFEHEYSKAFDTLSIGVFDEKVNTYIIMKKAGFYRIKEGIIQPKEYSSQSWVGVYDESSKVLQELKTGVLFTFSPDRNSMLFGSAEYKKIK